MPRRDLTKLIPYLLAAFAVVDIFLWGLIIGRPRATSPELYFLNIGQGDSEMVNLPSGSRDPVNIIIDGGPSGTALLNNLAKILPATDRYIDLLVMSHPQLDHFAGFIDVLKNYRVGAFIGNGRLGTASAYRELHDEIVKHNVPYVQLAEGDAITVGDSGFNIIGPSPDELKSKELNDTALVMRLSSPSISALYTGDIGTNVEDRLVAKYDLPPHQTKRCTAGADIASLWCGGLHSDVLKVGHHGSKFSSGTNFVKAVNPKISVIEVGKNTYGHPTQQALSRLASVADQIFRTDKTGLIKITSENGQLKVFSSP